MEEKISKRQLRRDLCELIHSLQDRVDAFESRRTEDLRSTSESYGMLYERWHDLKLRVYKLEHPDIPKEDFGLVGPGNVDSAGFSDDDHRYAESAGISDLEQLSCYCRDRGAVLPQGGDASTAVKESKMLIGKGKLPYPMLREEAKELGYIDVDGNTIACDLVVVKGDDFYSEGTGFVVLLVGIGEKWDGKSKVPCRINVPELIELAKDGVRYREAAQEV